jgi:hypothetical protein
MEVVSFANNTKCLSAKYIDSENIDIKNFSAKLEQDFTVINAEAFNAANDVKIGGYSALYLTEKKYGEDIFEYKNIEINNTNTIVTDLIIESSTGFYFLNINTPKIIDSETRTTCELVPGELVNNINNTYFEIQLLDTRYCRVFHRVNNDTLFMTANSGLDVFFTNTNTSSISAIDEYVFTYILDKEQDKISFYKPIGEFNYSVSVGSNNRLTLVKNTSASFAPFNSTNTFKIKYTSRVSEIAPKLNTSWISYSNINNLEINPDKSSFKNKNNYLFSTQYSNATGKDISVNFLPLKNQLTKEGISQRGDYLLKIPNKLYPQTSLRDYNKIQIGGSSEKGIDDISLTYNFYNTEFIFKPDEYTAFTTPDSLYPYVQLNINDTLFAINGALGGDSPHSSDKIYTKNIQGSYPNIGNYLCTWLSGGNETTPGLWVDRYFNTSKITPIEALTATAFKLYDFTSSVEEKIEEGIIANDAYFDVKSDLTIDPSREYIYQRLGNKYITSFIKHLDNNIILDSLTARTFRGSVDIPTPTTEVYRFNNSYHYGLVEEDVSSFTFSFWLNTDWDKPFGYQLAGNFSNKGFGIFNDESITPFILIPCLNSIYVYNTDFDIINKIDFDGKILNVIRINSLDDVYVIVRKSPNTITGPFQGSILYKIKSNGTVFDAEILAELPSYINYINTENKIFFLLDGSPVDDDVDDDVDLENGVGQGEGLVVGTIVNGDVAVYDIPSESVTFTKISIPREYGVDFDIKSLGFDKFGNLIGFRGEKCLKFNDDSHIFLLRSGLVVQELDDHSTRTILMSSASIIYDFAIDSEENLYVLHNKYLSKFNAQRDLIYRSIVNSNLTNISIDIVREYTQDGLSQYPIVMAIDGEDSVYLSKINDQTGASSTISIDDIKGEFYNVCNPDTIFNYYNLTNYSFFLKNNQPKNNNLKFRLEIPNKYNNRENLSNIINVDISKLSIGKHHFAYRLDTISGNITLFLDGKKITNITFDPAEYALQNTLYNAFNVGATSYLNSTIINNYIKQNGYYFCRDIVIEQPRLFNKGIDDIDIKFLNMLNLKVGELVASLPCGQRNQVEHIQRYFKWQVPGNKSNNINVRVKSNILANNKVNQVLKEIIRRDISNSLPASVNINDIIFEKH